MSLKKQLIHVCNCEKSYKLSIIIIQVISLHGVLKTTNEGMTYSRVLISYCNGNKRHSTSHSGIMSYLSVKCQ